MKWYEMVQGRLAELQTEMAADNQVTVASLMSELEQARLKATSLNQLAAAVRATGEKIKLSGLATAKIEVKQSNDSPFTDDMSPAEILAIVAREKGAKAAWHIAMSFGLDPNENGIAITGRVIWEDGKQIEGESRVIAGEVCEARHAGLAPKSFGVQRLIEERKPKVGKRAIG